MKRFLSILVSIIFLTMMACNFSNHHQTDDHLVLVMQNSMIIDTGDYVGLYLHILDEIKNAPSKKEYIDGIIDDFLRWSTPSNTVHSILNQTNIMSFLLHNQTR